MLKRIEKTKKEKQALATALEQYKKNQELINQKEVVPLLVPNLDLSICVIIDIDGTLAFRGKRGVFDFKKSIDDAPNLAVKYILCLIDDANKYRNPMVPDTEIIIITGREDCWQDVTNAWLNKHQIPFDHMYMRRTGDHRPNDICKEDIWAEQIRGKYNVLFVIDDMQKVLDMFKSHGIYCLTAAQVNM